MAAGVGLLSAGVGLSLVALGAAANELGWHGGGYATGWGVSLWLAAIFGVTVAVAGVTHGWPAISAAILPFAAGLATLLSLMIIFACNAVQSAIVFADLVQRDERVMLHRAFRHLDRRWLQAHLENRIAMVSGHPLVYQVLGFALAGLIVAHAVHRWFAGPADTATALSVARDFVLLVFVFWQIQWYASAYHYLRSAIVPDK